MMAFTDNQIKQLKEWWKHEFVESNWSCQECGINQRFDIPALLHRLDAAERCSDALASLVEFHDISKNTVQPNYSKAVLEAWRKAKGESK